MIVHWLILLQSILGKRWDGRGCFCSYGMLFVIASSESTVVCWSPLSMQSFRLVYTTSRWAYSNRNKDISESSFKPCYLDAVISIDCQLDRI